ncbi:hypothetical protein NP493_246g01014 [Ridgeia piscesae]|uniref:Pinin/SDK domain-containing protein n=1 Tax=Ridgeia piscesae TaxID=27915 RepID=A0AAD9NZ08_RIDPI|nr:hypothetical protein NP493_246g01014 [Ridgeia piscesae]
MADTASVVKGVAALQDELEKTRDRLRGVDETIKKLTGRDPSENRPGQRRIVRTPDISRGVELGRGRERMFALARYGVDNDRGPPAKRQVIQSAFGRLGPQMGFNRPGPRRDRDSGDEDDLPRKVTLHSSVVVTPKETRTRTDTLAAQNEDTTGKARYMLVAHLSSCSHPHKLVGIRVSDHILRNHSLNLSQLCTAMFKYNMIYC